MQSLHDDIITYQLLQIPVRTSSGFKPSCLNESFPSTEKAELAERQVEVASSGTGSGSASVATNGDLCENTVNVLLNFEIKEV